MTAHSKEGAPMTLAFLDTETTGLADDCDVWEIGLILRVSVHPAELGLPDDVTASEDREYCWRIRPDLTTAEPTGLRIGRYYQRMGPTLDNYGPGFGHLASPKASYEDKYVKEARHIAGEVARLLDGATIVGAVPDFDDRHLRRFLRQNNHAGTWHYHLIDVETLAAGALTLPPPWNFDKLLGEFGLTYDEADRHTALGDARMVRDLYDKVLGRG